MNKIIALFPIILSACTFDVVVPSQNDAQVQDAGADQNVQDSAVNPNSDLLQLVDLTQIYDNCQRFSNDAGVKHLTFNAPYDNSNNKTAITIYMCSAYMNSSCNVEHLFVSNLSYYTTSHPTMWDVYNQVIPNTLSANCGLINNKDQNWALIITTPAVQDTLIEGYFPLNYIRQCASDSGHVYVALMMFYNTDLNAYMPKDTSAFTFTCN